MKNLQIRKKGGLWLLFVFFILFSFFQCKEDAGNNPNETFNPSKVVEISGFEPDSGGMATQLLIYGNNFGTDTSLIKVSINGKPAPLIGSTGSVMYVLVPKRTRFDEGWCDIKLQVGKGTQMKEVEVGQFYYIPHQVVSTLAGFTDQDGNTAIVDGPIDKAQFNEPYWLAFDNEKNIYLIEENNGLRFINSERTEVQTKFRTGNGMNRPRTIAFTQNYDTMFIAHDAGEWTDISQVMLTQRDKFTNWTAVHYSRQCNGGAIHPITFDYYFNSYEAGQVFKADRTKMPWERQELFRTGDVHWEFNIQFAPSGNFAYIVVINQHYVARANYDWQNQVLQAPIDFVGQRGRAGYADGSRGGALLNKPHQGAFDKDDNFYLCDALNHCIRKITPEGIVTTFAGRPGEYGYVDGELREAQFDQPYGIIFDKDDGQDGTFYIADQKNRRIRVITTE